MMDIQSPNSSKDIIQLIETCIKIEKRKLKKYIAFALFLLILCLPNCVRDIKEIPNTMNLYKNNSSFVNADIVRIYDKNDESKYIDISFNASNNKISEQKEISLDYFDFITKNKITQIPIIYIKSNPKKFEIILQNELQNTDILFERIEKEEKKSAYICIFLLFFSCLTIVLTPLLRIKKYKKEIAICLLDCRTIAEETIMFKVPFISRSSYITYNFNYNGKKYVGFSKYPKKISELNFIKKDSKFEIAFDPKNPRRNFAIDVYYYLSEKK